MEPPPARQRGQLRTWITAPQGAHRAAHLMHKRAEGVARTTVSCDEQSPRTVCVEGWAIYDSDLRPAT
ncbi:MAG: hypothetical protein M1374_04185 [Firmicutes bacterium]|nr:hypothetical protein [Bacillota bacterium]